MSYEKTKKIYQIMIKILDGVENEMFVTKPSQELWDLGYETENNLTEVYMTDEFHALRDIDTGEIEVYIGDECFLLSQDSPVLVEM